MEWNAVLRSAQGVSHKAKNVPCQDVGRFERVSNEIIIGAISDGAGSAVKAEAGARQTVAATMAGLREAQWKPSPISEEEACIFFRDLYDSVFAGLKVTAEEEGTRLRDYACTLLAFVLAPQWIAAMQIGDGFQVTRCAGKEEYDLLFEPKHGEYINEAIFVTDSRARNEMQVCVKSGHIEFLSASTDGLEHAALVSRTLTPHPPFFQAFEQFMREANDPEDTEKEIQEFLENKDLSKRHADDKTLFLCVSSKAEAKIAKEAPHDDEEGRYVG